MDHPHHGPRPVHLVRRRDSGKFQKAVYARLRQFQHHGDTAAGNLRRRSMRRRPSARKRRLHAAPHRRVVGCVVQPLESQTGARRTVQIGARPLRTQRRTYVPPEKSGFARTQQAGDRSRRERSQPTQGGAGTHQTAEQLPLQKLHVENRAGHGGLHGRHRLGNGYDRRDGLRRRRTGRNTDVGGPDQTHRSRKFHASYRRLHIAVVPAFRRKRTRPPAFGMGRGAAGRQRLYAALGRTPYRPNRQSADESSRNDSILDQGYRRLSVRSCGHAGPEHRHRHVQHHPRPDSLHRSGRRARTLRICGQDLLRRRERQHDQTDRPRRKNLAAAGSRPSCWCP